MRDEPTGDAPGDEVTRALTGLADYVVVAATDDPVEGLVIDVVARRCEAPCPGCGVFSARVKSVRAAMVTDAPAQGRRCRLRVARRAFRCDTPGCERASFTEASDEVPPPGAGHDPVPHGDGPRWAGSLHGVGRC